MFANYSKLTFPNSKFEEWKWNWKMNAKLKLCQGVRGICATCYIKWTICERSVKDMWKICEKIMKKMWNFLEHCNFQWFFTGPGGTATSTWKAKKSKKISKEIDW